MSVYKIRRVARARDQRTDLQLGEAIKQSDLPPVHSETHKATGSDPISPSDIGAETPAGAQIKADTAESNANNYTDIHEGKSNPHSGSQPIDSFATANRPAGISTGYMGFDTDLGKPIWWNGADWVDATGTIV